ncbi:MAG TPA: M48 family metalloprotease [Vicinamibacterales bacterium]|nr:M48 family metalloprotease [Vicinamibacterales bacterium]
MNESKATRYQRNRRRAQAVGVACGGAWLAILAFTPVGQALAAWAGGEAASGVLGHTLGLLFYLVIVLACWEAVSFLALWVAARADRRADRSHQARDARQSLAASLLLALPASFILAGLVLAAAWVAGSWWWLAAAIATAGALVAALHLAPGVLARASKATPIERPALVERLGALARRIHVPIASIDVLPADSTLTASAIVAGAGERRRVFIADGLMRDWADEEISVVVAHELAHHVHHDLWTTLVLDVVVLAGGFWLAGAVRPWVAGADAPPAGLDMLPIVALLVCGVWLAASPARHALSRWQERRADRFALQLTGSTDAFQAAIRRLAAEHLVEERPSRLTQWFYHRHPTATERLETARTFRTGV